MPDFEKKKFTPKINEKKLTQFQVPNLAVASRAASRKRQNEPLEARSDEGVVSTIP